MSQELSQSWPRPSQAKPIVIIGAGDIVNDAHLPAYKKAGFSVAGIYDVDKERAEALAKKWEIEKVYKSIEEVTANGTDCIYDSATPPSAIINVIKNLPDGAAVLIQKPLGEDVEQAKIIRDLCHSKNLNAAVNFQLRFSPMMLAVRDAMQSGLLGDLLDVEVHINISTPWHLFPFLKKMERVEITVHSIHYLDLIRSLAGNPKGVFVRSIADPRVPNLAQTRTSAILDYGDTLRAVLSINHNHDFGREFQNATIRFEGTKGCILVKLGLLLNYPNGEPDEIWFSESGKDWQQVDLQGSWFPDAFIGVMSNLQRFDAGEDTELLTRVDDAVETMNLIEACFTSNQTQAIPLTIDE
jgi:predicted dehydrogenase